jgi:hypothetical protein
MAGIGHHGSRDHEIMGSWDHGIMGSWDHGIMGSWDHGIMGVAATMTGVATGVDA